MTKVKKMGRCLSSQVSLIGLTIRQMLRLIFGPSSKLLLDFWNSILIIKQAAKSLQDTSVVLETSAGAIEIMVKPDWAPFGAERFLELVDAGHFEDPYLLKTSLG